MRSYLRHILGVVLFFFGYSLFAQKSFQFQGQVLDSISKQPIEMAVVQLSEINFWTTTNQKGVFSILNIPHGTYTVNIHSFGYKDVSFSLLFEENIIGNIIQLQQQNLALKEVTVTATENKFGTSSKIGTEAIFHIQPKSLTDIFQLLPGQITENPSLASPGQIKIREISENKNSALGALIIVDGAPISNDADMQAFSTAKSGNTTATPGTLGGGTDLRDISVENIESVEVIRGISSAEYGNLTSGVVLVKTKMGETPWNANLKVDPNSKIGSIGKGFKLKNDRGIVNTEFDYTQSYDDIRYKYKGYQRITGSVGYCNTWLKETTPLNFTFNLAYYKTLDEAKTDPELKQGEIVRSGKQGLRVNISGKWMLKKKWITNLEYSFSGTYAHVEDYEKRLLVISSGAVPYPISKINGEYKAEYLPGVFYSDYTMDGKPFSVFGKIKGDLSKNWGLIFNKLLVGTEWSINGNNGRGLSYDINRPPMNVLSVSNRPRAFSDLPDLHTLSFFMEDKVKIPIKTTELTLQGGVRYSIIKTGGIFKNNGVYTFEPRIIASYEIFNKKNNPIFNYFAINMGLGWNAKAPTLSYLNPDKAYFDEPSLNYYDGTNSLAIITTKVIDNTSNPSLKPATSLKKELGFDIKIKQVAISLTAFYEKTKNGFSFVSQPAFIPYRKFSVTGANKNPVFENGEVYYFNNGEKIQASYIMDTSIRTYNTPVNNEIIIKKGVEYTINLGRIEKYSTSFILDGAWIYNQKYNTIPTYEAIYSLYNGKTYPYIAQMPAGKKTIEQRFNTNIRTITHIPAIRLVVSLTTQIIWIEREKYLWENENGTPYVYYYKNGVRIDGDRSAYNATDAIRYVDPIAFVDKQGIVHPWQKEYSLDSKYLPMVNTINSNYYFEEENFSPVIQFNLRLTKEFSQNFKVSFMANNFLKMNPYQKLKRTSSYIERNTPLYFGAELSYKF